MNPVIDPEKDYYAILEISDEAGEDEIKRAYREMARRYHPDSGSGDVAAFRLVQEAYDVLRDTALRRAYDRQRMARTQKDAPIALDLLLSRDTLPTLDVAQMVYLLLDIRPASSLPKVRRPLNLALVIDRSTSMRGQRIENVKLAARDLVDSLEENDRLALVTFSDRAELLAPSTRALDKAVLHSAIARLLPSGGTEIYQGLFAGLEAVRGFANHQTINHVIILTDGRTYGDEDIALNEAKLASEQDIGISALGIGEDWNDLFLDTLARYGNGICEYISSPSQLQRLLRQQIRGLSSTLMRGLKLSFKGVPFVTLQSVYRVAPFMEKLDIGGAGAIALGNLGEEALSILLEIVVQPQSSGARRMARLALESSSGSELDATSVRRDVYINFSASRATESEKPPTRLLNLLSRLSIFRLQERAWHALESGDTHHATTLLESAATRLFERGYHELAQAALLEAGRISQGGAPSSGGRKKLRYGTRALSISAQ